MFSFVFGTATLHNVFDAEYLTTGLLNEISVVSFIRSRRLTIQNHKQRTVSNNRKHITWRLSTAAMNKMAEHVIQRENNDIIKKKKKKIMIW